MENKILKATKNVLPPTFIPIRGEMLVEIRYIPHNLSKDEAKKITDVILALSQ